MAGVAGVAAVAGVAGEPAVVRAPTAVPPAGCRPPEGPRHRADLSGPLWVLGDVLGATSLEYGCGIGARQAREEGRELTEAGLDEIRDVCRRGTYHPRPAGDHGGGPEVLSGERGGRVTVEPGRHSQPVD
ncbi:hypothetical protein ABZZ79_11125 [Streptomyces sp. NPDC006458]|uniref:hypothetical protein n=1 Tax=Streptomyces sp. NPDC006458 TaxID=3154302 RepID=UPI0033B965B9